MSSSSVEVRGLLSRGEKVGCIGGSVEGILSGGLEGFIVDDDRKETNLSAAIAKTGRRYCSYLET